MTRDDAFTMDGVDVISNDRTAGSSVLQRSPESRRRQEDPPVEMADGGGIAGRRHAITRELMLIASAGLLYSLVRGLTDDRVAQAFDNAARVIELERAFGMFVEPDLQRSIIGHDLAVNLANAVYVSYWPVIIGTLVWLLLVHPTRYARYRTAALISGGLSLALFALFPLAPPRFLPEHGFVDTIALHSSSYRGFQGSALVNEYAAMPSLHLGWLLLVGIAVAALARRPAVRFAGALAPAVMFASIVLTANHYIVDGLVGAAIVLVALSIATWWEARSDRLEAARDPAREPSAKAS